MTDSRRSAMQVGVKALAAAQYDCDDCEGDCVLAFEGAQTVLQAVAADPDVREAVADVIFKLEGSAGEVADAVLRVIGGSNA